MYQFIRFLGWLIVILYLLSVDRYYLRLGPFQRNESLKTIRLFLVKRHKIFGISAFVIGLIHGFLAFTRISPSLTGSLTLFLMITTVAIGIGLHYKKIKLSGMKTHRTISILIVVGIVIHVLYPYLFLY